MRHGRGDVGVLAAFLQDDPGTRLRVLDHDVVDHRADANGCGGERRGDLERHVHGREARRVERVLDGTREAERGGHRVAVKGPARAVEDGGAHRAHVEAGVAFGEAFAHAKERGGDAEEMMGVGGRLRGDAVRVARHDRVDVAFGKRKQVADHVLEACGKLKRFVAKDRRALRREDVLARAARVNGGHALARGLDEKRLPCDVALDAKRGIRLAHGLDGRNAGGRPAGEVLAELAVAKARHDRRAVDGVEPEEFVLFHFQVL